MMCGKVVRNDEEMFVWGMGPLFGPFGGGEDWVVYCPNEMAELVAGQNRKSEFHVQKLSGIHCYIQSINLQTLKTEFLPNLKMPILTKTSQDSRHKV